MDRLLRKPVFLCAAERTVVPLICTPVSTDTARPLSPYRADTDAPHRRPSFPPIPPALPVSPLPYRRPSFPPIPPALPVSPLPYRQRLFPSACQRRRYAHKNSRPQETNGLGMSAWSRFLCQILEVTVNRICPSNSINPSIFCVVIRFSFGNPPYFSV